MFLVQYFFVFFVGFYPPLSCFPVFVLVVVGTTQGVQTRRTRRTTQQVHPRDARTSNLEQTQPVVLSGQWELDGRRDFSLGCYGKLQTRLTTKTLRCVVMLSFPKCSVASATKPVQMF